MKFPFLNKFLLRHLLDTILSLLGLFIVVHAIRESKTWEWWRWENWQDLGQQELTRPTLKSLEKVFADDKISEKLRRHPEKIAIWSWKDAKGSHGHDFSLPIRVSWFLLPNATQLPLVRNAEEAQAYDWIIDEESISYRLEKGRREVKELWAKDGLYLYELGNNKPETEMEEQP